MNGQFVAGIEIDSGQPTPQAPPAASIFLAGDQVVLIRDVPGRKVLRAGLRGEVVMGDEADVELRLLSVSFPNLAGRTWLLRRQHLRHVAPEVEVSA